MWKFVGASVIGTSHAELNLPCQDNCHVENLSIVDGADYLLCLVSDGAGSAKEGGQGAKLACATAKASIVATLLKHRAAALDESMVEAWINDIRCAIAETASANALTPRDYACTFLGALITPGKAVFFQIGDGAIVASSSEVQGVVFWPDSGPYANMTHFVTEDDALIHLHVLITNSRIEEVALFTDGIQRLALSFEQLSPHTPFFDPMFKALRSQNPANCGSLNERLADFLNGAQINSRTDDDKTLILASRRTK